MIEFEIKKKNYVLPEVLTIENYVRIYKVKDLLGEEYFQAKLINAITGAKLEHILQANHNQINYLSEYILSLFPPNDYPFIDKFILNGVEYGFIPSWKHMSFAEFVDLDTLLNKKPEEIVENLHIICAIMYRPIISKKKEHDFQIEVYDSKTMEERAEIFKKELDVKYVLGGNFFFSNFVKKKYSKKIIKTPPIALSVLAFQDCHGDTTNADKVLVFIPDMNLPNMRTTTAMKWPRCRIYISVTNTS
jgi:hypothetical protein